MKYLVKTLGCKANFADSQSIEAELRKLGWSAFQGTERAGLRRGEYQEDRHENSDAATSGPDEPVRLCIVNSCTVTNEADKQTRKIAAKLSRDNPHAIVAITGCAAEVNPESFLKSSGVHYIVGNQNKDQIAALLTEKIGALQGVTPSALPAEVLGSVSEYAEMISRHPLDREWPAVDSFKTFEAADDAHLEQDKKNPDSNPGDHSHRNLPTEKTRAFFKIQEGCNAFCTYCIIPYGRGPSRSLRPSEIIIQIRDLIQKGIKEVVLTGTNIGDYGTDLIDFKDAVGDSTQVATKDAVDLISAVSGTPTLADLITLILEKTDLQRLRLSSLDPTELTPQIRELMAQHPRVCPHFHVSLQSPHTRILKLMKRRYGFPEVQDCLNQISALGQAPSAPLGGVFVGMDLITGFPGETDEEFEEGYRALSHLPWHRLHVFPYSERAGTPATRLPKSVPPHIRSQRTKKLMQLSLSRLASFYRGVLEQSQATGAPLENVLLEKRGHSRWIAGYTPNYLRVLLPIETSARNQLITVWPTDLMIDTPSGDVALICTPEQPSKKPEKVF